MLYFISDNIMAEGNGNRYPGQAPGYYNGGYPVPPSGQPPSLPMPMFPPPTTLAEMFMSQFARDIQYNQYPSHNTQYPSHTSTQYHGHSAQYPIHGNHFPDNPNIQTNRHYEPNAQYFGNSHYSGNVPFQDRTNMQSQAKYLMPTSPIASVPFDNNYSKPNANVISQPHTTEPYIESKGGHSQSIFSGIPDQSVDTSINFSKFTTDPDTTIAHSESNATRDCQYTGRRENPEMTGEASSGAVSNTAIKSVSAPASTVNRGSSESGVFNSPGDTSGARSKGMVRGRGGRGRRGGRRGGYASERSGQQNPNGYSWYDSQENQAEERKRERDSALAETAAFMKNLNIRRESSSPQHDSTSDRRTRGRGRYDRGGGGGGGGGSGGRYQRDYCSDDKQGKEWVNRQVRTEGEKNFHEMQNNYTKQNNNSQRKVQQTGNSQNSGEWKPYPTNKDATRMIEGSDNNQNLDYPAGDGGLTPSGKPGGNVRSGRGRAQGKQDRKLWDSRHTGNSQTSTVSSGRNPFSHDSRSKDSNTVPPAAGSGKEDEESQRDRLSDELTKGSFECMVCCDRIKQHHAIWSCLGCFNCFHLGCIRKWAKTSTGGE